MINFKITRPTLVRIAGVVFGGIVLGAFLLVWLRPDTSFPSTPGERSAGYGYVPVDGLAVSTSIGTQCDNNSSRDTFSPLPFLPDISSRFAVGEISNSGEITYGSSKITVKNKSYKAVLDYVNVDVVPANIWIRKIVKTATGPQPRLINDPILPGETVIIYEIDNQASGYNNDEFGSLSRTIEKDLKPVYEAKMTELVRTQRNKLKSVKGNSASEDEIMQAIASEWSRIKGEYQLAVSVEREKFRKKLLSGQYTPITIPVYVGIGLRLTADVYSLKSGAVLDGLSGIAAQAEADALSGTLTVQAIGINGKSIGSTLPMPSKLDSTTVESAIFALGSSRAFLYSSESGEEANPTARVVGLYSPIGSDPKIINAIYTFLAAETPPWEPNCTRNRRSSYGSFDDY